jgi:hypothetical protein
LTVTDIKLPPFWAVVGGDVSVCACANATGARSANVIIERPSNFTWLDKRVVILFMKASLAKF